MDFWFHSMMVVKDTWTDISLIRFIDLFCDLMCDLSWRMSPVHARRACPTVIRQDVLHVSMKPIWLEYLLSPVSRVTCCMDDQPIIEGGAWKSPLFCASEPSVSPFSPVSASFTHSGALRLGACVL